MTTIVKAKVRIELPDDFSRFMQEVEEHARIVETTPMWLMVEVPGHSAFECGRNVSAMEDALTDWATCVDVREEPS